MCQYVADRGVMTAWLEKVAEAVERESGASLVLETSEIDELLRLARFAAHESGAKLNAPLVCYLVGCAKAGSELSVSDLAAVVRAATSEIEMTVESDHTAL